MLNKRVARVAAGIFALSIAVAGAGRAGPPQTDKSADRIHIASGQKIILELQTPLNTTTAREGDRVIFVTVREIEVGGKLAIPKGSQIGGTVTGVKAARTGKRAEVEFRVDSFQFEDGTKIPFSASNISVKSEDKESGGSGTIRGLQRSAGQAAQGAFLGALIGGGRQGALLGAAMGAGAEAAAQVMSRKGTTVRNSELDLQQGTIFEVKLSKALDVPARVGSFPAAIVSLSGTAPSNPARENPAELAANQTRPSHEKAEQDQPIEEPPPPPLFIGEIGGAGSTQPTVIAENSTRNGSAPEIIPPQPVVVESPSAPVPIIAVPPGDEASPIPVAAARIPVDAFPSDLPPFQLSVNVSLAQVDTVVRDRSGRPIDNLKVADFRLYEDGIEKPIQTFSRDESPLALALVVDRSESVSPFMNSIRDAAYKALGQLKTGDTACLFAFGDTIERREDLTSDLQKIANSIGSIRNEAGILQIDALYEAMLYLQKTAPDRRRVVIMISDNAEGNFDRNPSGFVMSRAGRLRTNSHTVENSVRLAQTTETVIYSIQMDGGAGSFMPLLLPMPGATQHGPVQQLTTPTGGEVFEVSSSGSVQKALATAIGRLKTRYTLGYSPTDETDKARKIEIRLVERFGRLNSDYTVLARSGQYAAAPQISSRRR